MPAIIQSRDAILADLESSEKTAGRITSGLSRNQGNWQPKPDESWSIWQCLDHLTRINRVYSQAMFDASLHSAETEGGTCEARPGWFGSRFISQMEPPVRTRFKAPSKAIPSVDGDLSLAVSEFESSHANVRKLLEAWDRFDYNHLRFKNPFVPLIRFTIATGILVINAHDRRHLSQAERIKTHDGFPPI